MLYYPVSCQKIIYIRVGLIFPLFQRLFPSQFCIMRYYCRLKTGKLVSRRVSQIILELLQLIVFWINDVWDTDYIARQFFINIGRSSKNFGYQNRWNI